MWWDRVLQGKAFQCGDCWDSKSRAWSFYFVEQWHGPALRAVRVFCWWNLASSCRSSGEGWPLMCPEGPYIKNVDGYDNFNLFMCDFLKNNFKGKIKKV